MAVEFRFPDVGEGITEGHLIKWLVKEGDKVKADQPVAEVETDKAVVELPSPSDGKVLKLHAKPGEIIRVGALLVTIGTAAEAAEAAGKKPVAPAEKRTAKRATAKGKRESISVVGELPLEEREITRRELAKAAKPAEGLALPAARKLAKDLDVDIASVRGTGKGGLVTEADVRAAASAARQPAVLPPAQLAVPQFTEPKIGFDKHGRVLRIPVTPTRRAIINRLTLAHAVPFATGMVDADITELSAVKEAKKSIADSRGVRLTLMPFIIRAAVIALKKHPYINSELDTQAGVIINKSYYSIGIAVATQHGLIVPVIKNADSKSMIEIAHEIETLAEAARSRTLKLEDMRGSTFSITNYGSIGVRYAVPVLNYPETAVLGVGRAEDMPVARDGKVVVRKMLPLSLTFDHRVVDGAEATLFLNEMVRHLEDPQLLLIDID